VIIRIAAVVFWVFPIGCHWGGYGVRVSEETVSIPTYLIGEPLTIPMFYRGWAYQGAQGHFRPYPVQDKLTYVRKDKTYKMLDLENRHVKIGVVPEIGGRGAPTGSQTKCEPPRSSISLVGAGAVGRAPQRQSL
jgi:hypothetical protein